MLSSAVRFFHSAVAALRTAPRAFRVFFLCAVLMGASGAAWAANYYKWTTTSGTWSDYSNWKYSTFGISWSSISYYPGDSSNTSATVYINTDDAGGSITVYVTDDVTIQNLYIESSSTTSVTLVLSEGVTLTVSGTLYLGNKDSNSDTVNLTITGAGTVSANTITYKNSASDSTVSIEDGATLTSYSFNNEKSADISVTGDGTGTLTVSSYTANTVSVDAGAVSYTDSSNYYIILDANGGSFGTGSSASSRTSLSVTKGSSLTLTNADTLNLSYSVSSGESGKAFLGWATTSDATSATYGDEGSFTPTASITLYAVWADVSTYYWRQDITDGSWTEPTNWATAESEDDTGYYIVRGGYPGIQTTGDTAYIPASSATTITLDSDITLGTVQFGMASYESDITLDTDGNTLTVTNFVLHDTGNSAENSTLTITGSGSLVADGFDTPNYKRNSSGVTVSTEITNTISIASSATMYITGKTSTFWGNADDDGLTTAFTGSGTLYVLASGANVEYGEAAVTYADTLTRVPYGDPTYYAVTADYSTASAVPVSSDTSGLLLTFTVNRFGTDDLDWEPDITFTYTAEVSGSCSVSDFTFAGSTLSSSGSLSFAASDADTDGTLKSSAAAKYLKATGSLTAGDSVTLYIYTPDKSLVLAESTYSYSGCVWTGAESTDWATAGNWACGSVPTSSDEVTVPSGCENWPVISASGAAAGSLYIAPNAHVTMTGGTLSLNTLTASGNSYFSATGGTLTFTGGTDGAAGWNADYAAKSTFYNVSIADDTTLTANADMTVSKNFTVLATGTIDLQTHDITCGTFLLNTNSTPSSWVNVAATLTGNGTVTAGEFNFPNAYTHTLTIDAGTTLTVTEIFYGTSRNGSLTIYGSSDSSDPASLVIPASGAYLNYSPGTSCITYEPLSDSAKTYLNISSTGSATYYAVNATETLTGISVAFTVGSYGGGVSVPFYYWVEPESGTDSSLISQFTLNEKALDTSATSASALAATQDTFSASSTTTLLLTYSGDTELETGQGGTLHIYTPDGLFELLAVKYVKDETPSWTGKVSTSWTEGGNWSCNYMPIYGSLVIPDGCSYYPEITESDCPSGTTYIELTLEGSATLSVSGGELEVKTLTVGTSGGSDTPTVLVEGGTLSVTTAFTARAAAAVWVTGGTLSASGTTCTISEKAAFEMTGGSFSSSSLVLSGDGGSVFTVSGGTLSFGDFAAGGNPYITLAGGTLALESSDTAGGALTVSDKAYFVANGTEITAESFSSSGTGAVLLSAGKIAISGAMSVSNSSGSGNVDTLLEGATITAASFTATAAVTMTGGTLTVSGDFTNSGAFTLGEAILTIGGNFTVDTSSGGSFSTTGDETTSRNTCAVYFTGDATLTGSASFTHLAFTGEGATVAVNDAITVVGACAYTGAGMNLTFSGANSFRLFLALGSGSTLTFVGENSFAGIKEASGGFYAYVPVTATFSAENEFDLFSLSSYAASSNFTFSDSNRFDELSILGAGSAFYFGAGTTQTVVTSFSSVGADGSLITLTTDAASPSVSDTSTWWNFDLEASIGQALTESDVCYTEVSYSASVNEIQHDWGDTVTETAGGESAFGSTTNWFLRTYYWRGGTDTNWSTVANWSLTADESVLAVTAPETDGNANIVIATRDGGNNLVMTADLYASVLRINADCTLDIASYSVSVVTFTNNGTLRLCGVSGQAIAADSITSADDSTVSYCGASDGGVISALVWDGDSATDGMQYANLVIEAGAVADLSAVSLVADVSGSCTNLGTLTFGTATVTVGAAFTNEGTFTQSGGTLTVSGDFTNSGTFSQSGGSSTLSGDLTSSGTYTASAGTLTLTGTAVTVSGSSTFAAVTLPTESAIVTFTGANSFTELTASGAGSTLTFAESNTFDTLAFTGTGTTVRFGAGKTQTVTTAFVCTGTESALITLTTDSSSPSISDTATWWLFDLPAETGTALTESEVCYTEISYSQSVNEIQHDWGDTVTETLGGESAAGSTVNWFLRVYYWYGKTSSDWATAANWSLTSDGSTQPSAAPETDGDDYIVICRDDETYTLVLSDDIAVSVLTVQESAVLDLASYSVTATTLTNNGTLRLCGVSGQAIAASSITSADDSTVSYYGDSDGTVSALVWDGDSATESAQYANLVIEASATADLSASTLVVDIAGDFTNSGSVTFGNAALTVSGNFTSSGSFTQTAGTLTLSGSGATQSLSVQSQTHKTDAAVFYNVVIASSARVETASSFTVSGNWTVESGALFSVLSSDEAESVITFTGEEAAIQGGGASYVHAVFSGKGATLSGANSFTDAAFLADTVLAGSNSFERFVAEAEGVTLTFAAGTTQTVSDVFAVSGTESAPVVLESGTSGSVWYITITDDTYVNVSYVTVSDSYSTYDSITAYLSTDGGNNTNWLFDAGISMPNLALMLAPVGENQAYAVFSDKLYYLGTAFDELDAATLAEALSYVPSNIEIAADGTTDDSWTVESAAYVGSGDTYSVLLLTFNQTVTLEHIRTLSVFLKIVSSTEKKHYHVLSDFALNVIEPLYAHADYTASGDSDSLVQGAFSQTVHDFTADSTDRLHSDADILIQAELTGVDEGVRAVLIPDTAAAISDSAKSDVVNSALGTDWRVWLPSRLSALAGAANTNALTPAEPAAVSSSSTLWNYTLENEAADSDSYGWTGGDEVQFLFKLQDADGNDITVADADGGGKSMPLYALSLSTLSATALPTLDLWSFKLKDTVRQRGGVTILNNVIDVGAREQTVVQVDMAEEGSLSVYVLSADGNIVRRLEHGRVSTGTHYYSWNGTNGRGKPVARGIYFIRVTGRGIDETRKVMCVKN